MNTPLRFLVPLVFLVYAAVSSAAEHAGTADIRFKIEGRLLTLETRDAPLHEVMREIGEASGFKTILVGEFIKPSLVNVSFEDIPLGEAIDRLVSDKNRIILYRLSEDAPRRQIISQVWLLQSGEAVVSKVESIASGGEADVNGYKLARLTRMLQQDQDKSVRARAAIALGTFEDERAVFALESALLDDDSRVRSQAITALGRIGNEQASIALGNLLLGDSADKSERILAARSLRNHDSEVARDYLRAAANDTDAQIRSASMNEGLSSNNVRNNAEQLGEPEAQ